MPFRVLWFLPLFLPTLVFGFVIPSKWNNGVNGYSWRRKRVSDVHATSDIVTTGAEVELTFELVSGVHNIDENAWNSLVGQEDSPFLEYAWIHALEKTGLACTETGWQPVHLAAYTPDRRLVAVAPMYAKSHSMGEFIFDQSWADFAERSLGIRYYPKLLVAVPFTPAVGKRFLIEQGLSTEEKLEIMRYVARFLAKLVDDNRLSSASVNWMLPEEVCGFVEEKEPTSPQDFDFAAHMKVGIMTGLMGGSDHETRPTYLHRETIQYRFVNRNKNTGEVYKSFDDYLSFFKSKRRVSIKRERRSIYEESRLRVEVIRGDDPRADAQFYQTMYNIYTSTVDKMLGQRYLSPNFFAALHEASPAFRRNLVFVVAFRDSEGENGTTVVGGTINVSKHNRMYGRYWGCFEEVKNLHFECCYYKTVEWCIENNIEFFEPGAGGGSFKFLRGFDPYIVNSVHYISSAVLRSAVADFLGAERNENREITSYLTENSKLQSRE